MDAITPRPRDAWIAGRPEQAGSTFPVTHPYDGTEIATVALPGPDQVERAVEAAVRVAGDLSRLPAGERSAALERVAAGLAARSGELAELITAESGTPLRWATAEVDDAVSACRTAAREARLAGELRSVDPGALGFAGKVVLARRVAKGPVVAAVAAHSPLGSAAGQAAPALAVGAPVVLVSSARAPLSALALGEELAEVGLPDGAFSVLPAEDAASLTSDERLVPAPGLDRGAGSAVALADWPDLDGAAAAIATAGTRQAGQAPVAVRRVIVEAAIAGEFVPKLTDAVRGQRTGDPYDTEVSVGPLPGEAAAKRVTAWLEEAVAAGAKVLTGGSCEGVTVEPALLTDVPADGPLWRDSPPGPVLAVVVAGSAAEAFAAAAGPWACVFTRDVEMALRASAELPADTLVVGEIPARRPRSVPATMRELTTERLTLVSVPPG